MWIRVVLAGLLLVLSPGASLHAQWMSNGTVGWYNGDWQPGIPSPGNWYASAQSFQRIYDDFVVPDGGWTIVGVFAYSDMTSTGVTQASWEIRSGVSAGKSGTVVVFGLSPTTQTQSVVVDGSYVYLIRVDGLSVTLAPGKYWLSVAPVTADNHSYLCTTIGLNAIGNPAGNDGQAFLNSPGSGSFFTPVQATGQGGTSGDFSLGVLVSVNVQQAVSPHRLRRPGPLLPVSGASPFLPGCAKPQTGINYRNAAVEPSVAVDPLNPAHLIGVWQQDRWSDGGATGLLTAVSTDRGETWSTTFAHFSQCSGGTFQRASDPWVTISPDGTAYQIALALNDSNTTKGILVSRSSDGGSTWSEPVTVVQHTDGGDDKEMIAADPTDPHYVYAVWDRTNFSDRYLTWFSRTTDGGASWEAARVIYDPGANAYSTAHQMAVLPNGALVDVFVLSFAATNMSFIAALQSIDHGLTWSTPILVSTDDAIGVVDAKTQAPLRTGGGIPNVAVDPSSGTIYAVWEDARFSGRQREGVALARSTDGGISWSVPVQVNQVHDVQAFTPSVAVSAGGTLAITYYDFRQDTDDVNTLLTNYWRITSTDGGNSWRETPVAGPFDLLRAPVVAGGAFFLGDYQALVASGGFFVPFFVAANSGDASVPTSVFASSVERAGNTAANGHVEINRNPRSISKSLETKVKPRPPDSQKRH